MPTSINSDPDQRKQDRVMAMMFWMKRLDLTALHRAFDGV